MHFPTTWIELDAHAFRHNIAQCKAILPRHMLGFVIKSNAYGHGIQEMAQLAEQSTGVDWFCVANLSDALTLRTQNIRKPILVMSCLDADVRHALNKQIDLVVYNYEMAEMLQAAGAAHDHTFRIHIKIDTGLSRLGILYTEALDFIKKIQSYSHLEIAGIFSHFAESNDEDQTYTLLQKQRFEMVLQQLRDALIDIPLRHLANTAGAMTLDLTSCTMARIGAGLLGLWPSEITKQRVLEQHPHFSLKPILTLKSRIINIKKIPAGNPIGYARAYYAHSDTIIANVPIGYFEGYDFRLFNQAVMRIENQYAPVIGRISMNLTTLDVTNIPNMRLGDEVIVMGNDPQISPYKLNALRANPNIREIHTRLASNIPRIIVD